MNRRLAAIVFFDIVGYSRAIGMDEASTLAALKDNQRNIINPLAKQNGGRLIKELGDGGLIEFVSSVDAVQFAISTSYAISQSNRDRPEAERLQYRFGINIGDIVADGDDIYGDGVNIAARLENLAPPNGICIHQSVRDQIRGKLSVDVQPLGEVALKNIEKPVTAFNIVLNEQAEGISRRPPAPSPVKGKPTGLWRWGMPLAASVIVALGIGFWRPWEPTIETASVDQMSFPLPDKPSLAVLPFDNMSDEAGQDHFVDGMTEDLITDLSKVSGLFVVARNSTFVYRGQSVNIARVAEDLGVRYVLEGSVRRVGDKVRVNAQLIDATTGGHVWAERYDGVAADVFTVQDEFVHKIAGALAVNLTQDEIEEIALGQTSNIEARMVFQDGWEKFLNYNASDNAVAVEQFKAAIQLDPDYGRAHAALSLAYLRGCRQRWNEELNMSAGEANVRAQAALNETQNWPSSLANVASSQVNLYNNRYKVAQTEATLAIAKDPNDPEGYVAMAWAMITTGEAKAGLELLERATRLSPTHPNYYVFAQAMAHYALDELEVSAGLLANALERDPEATELAVIAASIYAQLDMMEEARAAVDIWSPGLNPNQRQTLPYTYHFPYEWADNTQIEISIMDGLFLATAPTGDFVGELAEQLKEGNKAARVRAAKKLSKYGPKAAAAVPALIEALRDQELSVQREAAIALGQIGPAAIDAVPVLETMRDERIVGRQARKAIGLIRAD